MPAYNLTVDGIKYKLNSDTPLTDEQVHQHANEYRNSPEHQQAVGKQDVVPPEAVGRERYASGISLPEAGKEAIKNLPESAHRLGTGIAESVVTGEAITSPAKVAAGALRAGTRDVGIPTRGGEATESDVAWNQFKEGISKNYGSWEGFKEHFAKDPAQVMAAIAQVIPAAGAKSVAKMAGEETGLHPLQAIKETPVARAIAHPFSSKEVYTGVLEDITTKEKALAIRGADAPSKRFVDSVAAGEVVNVLPTKKLVNETIKKIEQMPASMQKKYKNIMPGLEEMKRSTWWENGVVDPATYYKMNDELEKMRATRGYDKETKIEALRPHEMQAVYKINDSLKKDLAGSQASNLQMSISQVRPAIVGRNIAQIIDNESKPVKGISGVNTFPSKSIKDYVEKSPDAKKFSRLGDQPELYDKITEFQELGASRIKQLDTFFGSKLGKYVVEAVLGGVAAHAAVGGSLAKGLAEVGVAATTMGLAESLRRPSAMYQIVKAANELPQGKAIINRLLDENKGRLTQRIFDISLNMLISSYKPAFAAEEAKQGRNQLPPQQQAPGMR